MKAVVAADHGGPEVLELVDRPDPEPGPDELLVRVRAAALNYADVMQRQGSYPPPDGVTDVLGLELAGEVEAVGGTVEDWKPGDRVCGLIPGGAYAELAVLPASTALPVPQGFDFVQAAAYPEVFTAALEYVFNRGQLRPGQTLLVHGGAGGVGTAAIQLASTRGCTVIVTEANAEKLDACKELGAEGLINFQEEDFVERVRELTDDHGVDVILDIVGGPYLERNVQALALEGRLVVIGLMGGPKGELDLETMLHNRLTVMAATLRARPLEEKIEVARQVREEVLPGLNDGTLRPVVYRVLPMSRVKEAHQLMDSGEQIGKIVLTLDEEPDELAETG